VWRFVFTALISVNYGLISEKKKKEICKNIPETTAEKFSKKPNSPKFFFFFFFSFLSSQPPPETTSHHQERPTALFSDLDPPRRATTKERPTAWLSSQICNHRGHAVKHGPPRREARTTTPRSTNHLAVPIPTVWRWWSLPIFTVVFGCSDFRWFLVRTPRQLVIFGAKQQL
jgi:hypothetical protein